MDFYFTYSFTGDLVVADSENHRIQIFSCDGMFRAKFGSKGANPDQLNYPMCVAVTNDDKIAVTDSVNACVKVFTINGVLVSWFSVKSELDTPYGIAICYDQSIVVTDICNHCIVVLSKNGQFSHKFGQYGCELNEFDHPYYVAVNRDKHIFVSDVGNNSIKIFSFRGKLLRTFDTKDFKLAGENIVSLQGLTVDSDGNTIVACNNTIYILAKNGRLWEVITPRDGLISPKCVTYSTKGCLIVSQSDFNEIQEVCIFRYHKEDFRSLSFLDLYAISI